MSKGKLITFEGAEGAGKSTQVTELVAYLAEKGRKVEALREPGGTTIGEEIRTLFKDKVKGAGMCPETELLLMQAARAQLVREKINPLLASGTDVVCDRFFHSTVFYQGFGRGVDQDVLMATTLFATNGLVPDLTVVLTLPLDKSLERVKKRGSLDRLEEEAEAFFTRVHQGVNWLATSQSNKVLVVDGDQLQPIVTHEVQTGVWKRLYTEPSRIIIPGR